MHFCVLLITKDFPTNRVIASAMKPFNEEADYERRAGNPNAQRMAFLWDFWTLGGRYGASLKIDVSGKNFEKYELLYYAKEPRSNRLFRSAILETANFGRLGSGLAEEDALLYMGARDGVIYADAAKIEDLAAVPVGWAIVLPNGEAYSRTSWDGDIWSENPSFDEQIEAAIAENNDCWISVIDIHD